jgi:hypothetical protein
MGARLESFEATVSCSLLAVVLMTIPNNHACRFGRARDARTLGTLIRRCTFLPTRLCFPLVSNFTPHVLMHMRTTTGFGLPYANQQTSEASSPYHVSLLLFSLLFWNDYTLSNFFSLPIRP